MAANICLMCILCLLLMNGPVRAAAGGNGPKLESQTELSGVALAKSLLNTALQKTKTIENPTESLLRIVKTGMKLEPKYGISLVRQVARIVDKKEPVYPSRLAHVSLAKLVAPYDRKLRDDLLHTALGIAQKRLKKKENWKAKPLAPGVMMHVDPQASLDKNKTLLRLRMDLWRIIRDADGNSVTRMNKLLAEARSKGNMAGDAIVSMRYLIKWESALLTPDLLRKDRPVRLRAKTRRDATVELFRRGEHKKLLNAPHVNWYALAFASKPMPPKERIEFLFKCMDHVDSDSSNSASIVAQIFRLDHREGMRALDILMKRTTNYCVMTFDISRVSPEGLLKLYKANRKKKKLFSPRCFAELAIADADFA